MNEGRRLAYDESRRNVGQAHLSAFTRQPWRYSREAGHVGSGLYFRGKLAYARRFSSPPDPSDPVTAGGVLVITPNAGLRAADVFVTLDSLRRFAGEPIDLENVRYRRPLERSARALLA